eukprot:5452490-Prymnesium_polylepis.1
MHGASASTGTSASAGADDGEGDGDDRSLTGPAANAADGCMATHPHLVLVYGTLMTGLGNHHKLDAGDGRAALVGRGVTESKHTMYAAGVPFVHPDIAAGGANIHGEVWAVDAPTLERMDGLEGHPDWYFRMTVNVLMDGGSR